MTAWARAFNIVYPDGRTFHGARFPSGRVVVDETDSFLVTAAVDIAQLPMLNDPEAKVVWGPDPEEGTTHG